MTHSTDLKTLASWMASDFSNRQQAFENPPLFAQVRACMRPLPPDVLSGVSFYLEQAYEYALNRPYRTRVLNLQVVGDGDEKKIVITNYAIANAEEFFGASREPQRLSSLTSDRLTALSGCNFIVDWTGRSFKGTVEPGKRCLVERNGKTTYLDSTFEISATHFTTLDRGYDPDTGERVWGSVAGAFEFERLTSFANEVRT
ncbi:chromophore lyase CpcT/CpeT [Baaleninema simplex]|uniref:chromophore lyase CpcT/CpeT n=1 Tax=Baaleninema simplex TaxID=2862350 RepID=UPI000345BB80|nr:chromophore lyase CpcT/CpeT [Baaleninema simplex]